jgi:hypothetical protein
MRKPSILAFFYAQELIQLDLHTLNQGFHVFLLIGGIFIDYIRLETIFFYHG